MARKRQERNWQFNYLSVVIVLTVILVTLSIIEVQQFFVSRNRYASLNDEYQSLKLKEDNLKPDISDILSGKFDLRAKERELDNDYTILTKALFGDAKSVDAINERSEVYTKYFSKKGWNNLSQLAIVNQDRFIAKSNSYVKTAYSNLDLSKKTMTITVFTKFDLSKDSSISNATYGVAYIKINYDLQHDRAIKSTVNVSYPEANDD